MTKSRSNDFLHYCYYQINAFSAEECQTLIDLNIEQNPARIMQQNKEESIDKDIRFTLIKSIPSLPDYSWIFERLQAIVLKANQQFFNFEIDLIYPLQVLEYPVGGNYNWHSDIGVGKVSNRKLSVVVFLSDYPAYDGGRLRVPQVNTFPQTQGTLIIFPSYIRHKVEPVTRGVRHSLVAWACGPCFR